MWMWGPQDPTSPYPSPLLSFLLLWGWGFLCFSTNEFSPPYFLGELGSYILGDTPEPWRLEAPGPWLTIKQSKEARKGNGSPCKGNRWPRQGNGPPQQEPRALLIVEHAFICNGSPYGFDCRGPRGAPKRNKAKIYNPSSHELFQFCDVLKQSHQ